MAAKRALKYFGVVRSLILSAPAPIEPRLSRRSTYKEIGETREILERLLTENIVSFWLPATLDNENGGYRHNHDADGRWRGPAPKGLISHARALWFFSRLSRSPYGDEASLAAARHGYQFLRAHMWDEEFGGFFWEVAFEGRTPTMPDKHLYGQAFALFALAEYAGVATDHDAKTFALDFFHLLEHRFHDPVHGGYREFLRRDWQPVPDDEISYIARAPAALKLMNTHLHLMEALVVLQNLSGDPLVRDRLIELILVQSNAVVRKAPVIACTDRHRSDWTPLRGLQHEQVSYGHDVENVSLLIDACDAAGLPNGPLSDLYGALFANALHYGWDDAHGGFFFTGPIGAPAVDRTKSWWVQAEAMLSALRMFRLAGKDIYRDCYFETLRWIEKYQVDWEGGDWHNSIISGSKPSGKKADKWKTPYHNGRAVIECLALLGGGDDGDELGTPETDAH